MKRAAFVTWYLGNDHQLAGSYTAAYLNLTKTDRKLLDQEITAIPGLMVSFPGFGSFAYHKKVYELVAVRTEGQLTGTQIKALLHIARPVWPVTIEELALTLGACACTHHNIYDLKVEYLQGFEPADARDFHKQTKLAMRPIRESAFLPDDVVKVRAHKVFRSIGAFVMNITIQRISISCAA